MHQSLNSKTDEEIAHMVQLGETELFGILVKRYEIKISRYARKFLFDHDDTKDVVQQVFIKAYINIKSFDASRKFSPWLYRIAHNEFINTIKKKKREPLPFFNFDILFPYAVSKEKTDKVLREKELRSMINKSLNKLEPKYREPLILHYLEGLSYQDISDILKVPISTIGVRIRRAKQSMEKTLKKLDYQP